MLLLNAVHDPGEAMLACNREHHRKDRDLIEA
jgi:hypothetical protein